LIDLDDSDLLAIDAVGFVPKSDRTIDEATDELLERMVGQMVRNANNDASTSLHVLDANQDVGVRTPPCVRESDDILGQFGPLVVTGSVELVLIAFEVEGYPFVFVQQSLEQISLH
jgi:hypothetical protein